MGTDTEFKKYIYWLDRVQFDGLKDELRRAGMKTSKVLKTPCEVLKASGDTVRVAAPEIWSLLCKRQGSWYRESDRAGKLMLASARRLPEAFDPYLDAEIGESEFRPAQLPDTVELKRLVDDEAYRTRKPADWEKKGLKDSIMFKAFFTVTGFWGWGDNLDKHWLGHRANHANFLSKRFTTDIDGEAVPYSVTGNESVCSACVEFFNVVEKDSRKLVRACPGSVAFAGVERDRYYDVRPCHG